MSEKVSFCEHMDKLEKYKVVKTMRVNVQPPGKLPKWYPCYQFKNADVRINYCPVCGKKLELEDKGETDE